MASIKKLEEKVESRVPLWELGIEKVEGRSLEKKGRDEINEMLADGWVILHVYTLRYRDDENWIERPMAILGLPKHSLRHKRKYPEVVIQ